MNNVQFKYIGHFEKNTIIRVGDWDARSIQCPKCS